MKCEDIQQVLPEILDGAPDSAFQSEFETHLKSCPDCADLVSDLQAIASEARQLEGTEEPPQRVWVRIAAELRAEGLIKDEPPAAFARPALVPASTPRRWNAWWLAPVAAAILAVGSYVVNHQAAPQIAKQPAAANPTVANSTTSPAPVIASAQQTSSMAPAPIPVQAAKTTAQKQKTAASDLVATEAASPAPSTEDQQFLSVVSTLSPSMRVTYENQLQAVNADIRETQAYVDRNPGDPDARQHLMDAYQQKELLYQIALDRIQ